jgi:hypothetical protein
LKSKKFVARLTVAVIMLGMAELAQAVTPLPTVGIYDENTIQPNTVDFQPTGNTWLLSNVEQTIGLKFASDLGGVFQCEENSSDRQLVLSYGADNSKILTLDGVPSSFGVEASNSGVRSISGVALFAGLYSPTVAQESFSFDSITGGLPAEELTRLGLTILSANRDYGLVTATATFSDGSTAVASRHIQEAAGLGDTFFGFVAPPGASILELNFSAPSGHQFFFDDVAFVTAPEPSSIFLLAIGATALLCRARRAFAPLLRELGR